MNSRDFEDIYPLTPLQEGMLFHSLFGVASGEYVVQLACRIADLDAPAFEEAWAWTFARHAALRTAFVWKNTRRPFQVVVRELPLPIAREDLRPLPAVARAARIEARLAAEREHGFDLSRPPLMRLVLLRTGESEHHFIWTLHHLLLDGWSSALVLEEVVEAYAELRRGGQPRGPEVRPYRDFIAWLEAQDGAQHEAYWRGRLRGLAAPTVPGIAHGPQTGGEAGGRGERQIALPRRESAALDQLCRANRLTLSTMVQAAWALLLSRYSATRDVVYGSVVSGRPAELAGIESMVGLFINTVPVRAEVDLGSPFLGWVRELQAAQLELLSHLHVSLGQIQRWSELPAGAPLFTVLFAFENFPVEDAVRANLSALRASDFRSVDYSNYPLSLSCWPEPELPLFLDFDELRYDAGEAERFLGHLRNLLAAAAASPDRPCGDLPLLSAREREHLVAGWNPPPPGDPPPPVHELFARRAAAAPGEPAVASPAGDLTFGELAAAADRLAARLVRAGVRPEARVALLADRSPALAVGILGIFQAGGVVLPLDPALPAERLRRLLDAARPAAAVAPAALAHRLPAGPARVVVAPDDREEDPAPPLPPVDPAHLAYVIYTSGSTGEPKGVQVAHGALASYALAVRGHFDLGPGDRFLQFSPLGFNVVFEELLPAWLSGAAVVLEPRVEQLAPAELQELIAARRVTALELPAGFWHEWVRELAAAGERPPGCLRLLVVGCERPAPERVATWRPFGVPLVVIFGLTEATITSTLYRLEAGEEALDLPIGSPIANSRVYLLDTDLELVPPGAPGELAIGGASLARGYLDLPERTAERFLPDPFGTAPGARLYRSGDLARFRPDGTLDLLGRMDHQVKIRGFRVEPGEVEAALLSLPAVADAAVVAAAAADGHRRLVAYVALSPPGAPAAEPERAAAELREALAARLPAHLVPALIVPVAEVPRTRSGKVDRGRLPAPAASGTAASAEPRSPVEAALAAVWAEVLGRERVGVEEDFFALGGDSILSLQIVSRAARAGLRLSPRQIFENPTVAALARVAGTAAAPAAGPPPAAPAGTTVPLVPLQRWLFGLVPSRPERWNMPLLLTPRDRLHPARLAAALGRLVARHDALRLRFVHRDAGFEQELGAPRAPSLAVVDLAGLAEGRQGEALAAAAELQGTFVLARPPLLAAACFDLGAERGTRLLLVAHHLIADGVSWRVLSEDLWSEYAAAGGSPSLPERTATFAAWAEALAAHAASEALAGELPHWLATTAGPLVDLPRDGEGENREAGAAVVTVYASVAVTRAFREEVPPVYRTAGPDLLLAALSDALAAWAGEGPLLVDLEGHGRDALAGVDAARTVGWLATLYPVRLDLASGEEPRRAILGTKERLRAVPGHGAGYGLLRYLSPRPEAAALAERPAAEVLFNYLGWIDAPQPGSPFAVAPERPGGAVDPSAPRSHLFEINAGIEGQRLRVDWIYGSLLHRRATVEELARRLVERLGELVEHCLSPGAGGYSPADFPLAGLTHEALDGLTAGARDVEDIYPLSPMQLGMVYHSLLEPESGVYLAQLHLEILGPLDAAAFAQAWQAAVERHACLRTTFVWAGLAAPLQLVWRGRRMPWHEEDLRGLAPAAQRDRIDAHLALDRDAGRSFSQPAAELLVRLALFRTGGESWEMVWTYFQGLLDGWSLPLLFRDLFAAYRAFAAGGLPAPAAAPRFRDYIAWLAERDLSAAQAFWRRTLAGFAEPTPLAVPKSAAGGEGGEVSGADVQQALDARETAAVEGLARRSGFTLNTLVLGAWALVLSRYGAHREVLFGTTVAGRPPELPASESMLGVFINTLPLRVAVDGRQPLRDWLRRIQEKQAEIRQFEHTPLLAIRSWSEVPPESALFDTLVVFENYPADAAAERLVAGLEIRPLAHSSLASDPFTLLAMPGAGLRLVAKHRRPAIEPATAARVLSHVANLLRAFAAQPEARLDDLSFLSAAERHQLTVEWSGEGPEAERTLPLPARIEAVARRRPGATAVVAPDLTLTYAELAARAERWAHRLRELGVRRGVRVGLFLDRSAAMVVGILATWRAGGAYVPLDTRQPPARLRLMIDDARPALVLTTDSWLDDLAGLGLPCLSLDSAWPATATSPPLPASEPGDLAYVLYTSGSTGRPKGVEIEHRQLAAYLQALEAALGDLSGTSFAMIQPLAVDACATALFPPLVNGGAVHLLAEELAFDAAALAAYSGSHRIDGLKIAPSHLAALGAGTELAPLLPERWLVLGGESLRSDLLARLRAARPDLSILNEYGPTETTVGATLEPCGAGSPPPATVTVPIGRPLAGVRTHLLDRRLQPVPIGVTGELLVGGDQVGRGYLARPAQTAASFVPAPFGPLPGARLYRTGDLARYLPDGRIQFLGRLDFQVKVRGLRIETEEIETVLARHPAVVACKVTDWEDARGVQRLVAYLVPAGEAPPEPRELAAFLAAHLPEPMVPSHFVALAELPLNRHGKLDRRALPTPAVAHDGAFGAEPPRTPVERQIAAIWCEVLDLPSIGVHDSFFALGGSSLHVIQVISRLRQSFGVEVPFRLLADRPTVADLALALVEQRAAQAEQSDAEEVSRMLAEIEQLPDDQIPSLLAENRDT